MIVLDDLQGATVDALTLELFLDDNFEEVYDFFKYQKHANLIEFRESINKYISLNRGVIVSIDVNKPTNLSFLALLLDISERLVLISTFKYLFEHLEKHQVSNIGKRARAASHYLIGIKSVSDYLQRYETIYSILQDSFLSEEDNSDLVLVSMINFYALVIDDFGQFNHASVLELKKKIEKSLAQFEFSFLNHPLLFEVLKIDTGDHLISSVKIRSLIDNFLGRDSVKLNYKEDFLIEVGTDYANQLKSKAITFNFLRQVSVKEYRGVADDSIFFSLQRGVSILKEEKQLFAYLYSYGKMHHQKLIEAFEYLPDALLKKEHCIIDWGCGQGIGTVSFFDFLVSKHIATNASLITLIEPSEVALKRASLHASSLGVRRVHTINKDFDSLKKSDLRQKTGVPNIHIFSNVLDIDLFSLTDLLALIHSSFKGTNYFVCISPYVNNLKIGRLNSFMAFFSEYPQFVKLRTLESRAGEWQEQWTRIYRIFKADIE
jgi:hypothetical protein